MWARFMDPKGRRCISAGMWGGCGVRMWRSAGKITGATSSTPCRGKAAPTGKLPQKAAGHEEQWAVKRAPSFPRHHIGQDDKFCRRVQHLHRLLPPYREELDPRTMTRGDRLLDRAALSPVAN